MSGRLVLCSTPIGNLDDVSARALRLLQEADVVACEDTRRTKKLLSHHGIKPRELVSHHEGNERWRANELLARIASGETVALVSDAGTPGLSDPGYRLVRACAERSLEVSIVPGPNAAISALVISGLPPARFAFEGFLPRKKGDRRERLRQLTGETRTVVFYESPHRILDSLEDLVEVFGDRPAAVVRELTKMYEEVRRGSLPELLEDARRDPPRGEIVVVVQGAIHDHSEDVPAEELARRALTLMDRGIERKQALTEVAKQAGVPRRKVFDALVDVRERGTD